MPKTRNQRFRLLLNETYTVGPDITDFGTTFVYTPGALAGRDPGGCYVSNDGANYLSCNDTGDQLHSDTFATPYDTSTFTTGTNTADIGRPWIPWAVGDDGTRIHYCFEDDVWEAYPVTPWNVATMPVPGAPSFTLPSASTSIAFIHGMHWKRDGLSLYLTGTGGSVEQYDTPNPYDLANLVFVHKIATVGDMTENPGFGLTFDQSGTKMYVGARGVTTNSYIAQYNLSVPWALTSAVFFAEHAIPKIQLHGMHMLDLAEPHLYITFEGPQQIARLALA